MKKKLNLYLITLKKYVDYDMYDSAVVAAYSEEEAKEIHPNGYAQSLTEDTGTWTVNSKDVGVELIGFVTGDYYKAGDVVCSSFNAG